MTKKKTQKSITLVPSKPAAIAPAPSGSPAAAPKSEPPVSPAVKPPASPVNRRITPGAKVTDWRVVRSLRASNPGYFLQGGHFQKTSRGNSFIVGEEVHFTDIKAANEALAARVPPKSAAGPTPALKTAPAVTLAAKPATSAPPVAADKSKSAPVR